MRIYTGSESGHWQRETMVLGNIRKELGKADKGDKGAVLSFHSYLCSRSCPRKEFLIKVSSTPD
ncbi:MAG: hypothetical protein F6J90_16810 [Moorea sp. SIOASIH]|uniref:hypothetical protein n=1 Tax=Moorena sp. SIOASIH TaxID=2607817 RepID=UPI0013B89F96|nr:hypothetical protein [Moorena sp. SIOASIH]NEO37900.1 hypothetical protein [Moorena sp. SIOASIH]